MSFPNNICEKCEQIYTDERFEWCKPCQINNFKQILKNWNIEKEINNLIEEMISKIKNWDDIVFEWIPYNQLNGIVEINKGDLATVYSAIWNDGPLHYHYTSKEYTRKPDKKVALKCVHNSQIIDNEFLNEVV